MVFKKKAISPFDEVVKNNAKDIQEDISFKDAQYLSLRAAVFMVSLILSLSGIFVTSDSVLVMSCAVASFVLLWCTTMRVWQTSRHIMGNALVNLLLGAVVFCVPVLLGLNVSYTDFHSILTVVGGVTALGSINKDYIKRFVPAALLSEILIPVLLAIVSVSVASISILVTDRDSLGNMVILSAVTLGAFSLILKMALKITYSFSSRTIVDYNKFPVANRDNIIKFYKERGFYCIGLVAAFVVSLIVNSVVDKYLIGINESFRLILPLVIMVVMALVGIVFKTKDNPVYTYEALGTVAFLMSPVVINLISAFILDLIIVGYLTTYKRRSIHAVKSVHIEGVPLLLIVLGVICLCVEALPL